MNKGIPGEWFVIVNPNAGRRKGEKDWLEIAALLQAAGIGFTSIFTEHPNHAVKLARKYVEAGFKKIIVVGGDGTLNEVLNGIFTQKKYPTTDIVLAMIPVGTGNDWGRTFNIPTNYKKAIELIARQKIFIQDVGRVQYISKDLTKQRHFINMAGLGFDAMVAKRTNKVKREGKSGPFSYLISLFSSLINYNHKKVKIRMDDTQLSADVFTMSVAICRFNGGGMMQAPNAIADDGLFDITVITRLSRLLVIRNVKKLYDGSFVKMPQVKTFLSKKVEIESDPPMYLETDGESLGHTPVSFEIIPLAIQVISGL
ncbi:MAG: diacylglycerol kinase family lipid kinase [Lentimicrobium sp.]|jgi:YegS/Rv2252/BmrU family lipid kinase|nr:diacylglycerol kinase family lipid kinase [Lentimicrobium sp.]MDD2528191.1 diacylglycerol kinase family lipid kinase [Lentimicrobiaceae bacterium]MDD4596875.1 diacylglycerol kinase family lipid kinase [Lentimicrobiaceae bacterium]MDY0025817.1 diacylglycerol kinase family lipid kinase [Lentimicrobium sp.]MDY0202412.1 diacylglycerol kinase family lipid kinase [Tenuifilaceae bacterium]